MHSPSGSSASPFGAFVPRGPRTGVLSPSALLARTLEQQVLAEQQRVGGVAPEAASALEGLLGALQTYVATQPGSMQYAQQQQRISAAAAAQASASPPFNPAHAEELLRDMVPPEVLSCELAAIAKAHDSAQRGLLSSDYTREAAEVGVGGFFIIICVVHLGV